MHRFSWYMFFAGGIARSSLPVNPHQAILSPVV